MTLDEIKDEGCILSEISGTFGSAHSSSRQLKSTKLHIKRITRSAIIVEINTKDVKLVRTNISSLHSKRHLQKTGAQMSFGM